MRPLLCFLRRLLTRQSYLDPGYNPAAEAFKNFDQDQQSHLLGSLHMETDEEPRRGASRANSVRFDESALHSHFGHASRASSDFFPLRTGSGLGSHPMTERTSSHKSDGRQSSAGHSNQSARTNSLGLEPRQPSLIAEGSTAPLGPPPGLFILGPVPSIIRCWLDTHFSNETLLYAALCTGSFKSIVDSHLLSRIGLLNRAATRGGERRIKLPVYLPEATVRPSSSRFSSPTPQLPMLTVDFAVEDMPASPNSMQIFLGCDILHARSADILLSQNRLTIHDDDQNKLAVPLVRPEKAEMFQGLITTRTSMIRSNGISDSSKAEDRRDSTISALEVHGGPLRLDTESQKNALDTSVTDESQEENCLSTTSSTAPRSAIGEGRFSARNRENGDGGSAGQVSTESKEVADALNGNTPETPTKSEPSGIWGSWRANTSQNQRQDMASTISSANSGYQRAGRGRGMKVLKPARSNTSSRSISATQTPSSFDTTPTRPAENGIRGNQKTFDENQDEQFPVPRRSFSGDTKSPFSLTGAKPRSANPVGGASAFGWLNPNPQKRGSAE